MLLSMHAFSERVALCIEMRFKLPALLVVYVLFFDRCDFKLLPQVIELLINRSSQKLNPVFELYEVRQVLIVWLLNEREPIDLAHTVIILIVIIINLLPIVPFYLAVDEVLLVVFLYPLHLVCQAHEELVREHFLVHYIVCADR